MRDDVSSLRFWRRFDVRTTLAFGGPVLVLLAVIGVVSSRRTAHAELEVLQNRLRGLAVGLSRHLDADTVLSLRDVRQTGSPPHRRLVGIFARVAQTDHDIKSIYIIVPTGRANWVRFACDWVRSGTPARIGELYDAGQTDSMMIAFRHPVVESRIYADAWGRNLSGYAPIRNRAGTIVAAVGVDMDAHQLEDVERHALVTTGVLYGIAIVLFALGGALVGRSIRRPIRRIIDATQAIAEGELDTRTGLSRRDELGILARRIDRMASELEQRDRMRAIFGRYVSEDVARRLLASPDALDAAERELTVLFTDIRRYSTISETLAPSEVLEMLNEYFAAMTDLVHRHGGCVIELVGDAILAVFGAPDELADHPAAAVRCALAMRVRLDELNDEWVASGLARLWRTRGIDRLAVRIGIHSGNALAGNLGSDRRAKYAVVGRALNVAVELEAKNEELGTTILVSADVYAALPPELTAQAKPQPTLTIGESDLQTYSL